MDLKLISANTQAGAATEKYHHYLTRAWYHVSPWGHRASDAKLLQQYDLIALQEADSGSLRSSFLHQAEELAQMANIPHCVHQTNRRIGPLLTSGNALISRPPPRLVERLSLPARRGRGVLLTTYPMTNGEELIVAVTHLSLRRAGRHAQSQYLARLLRDFPYVVLVGDFNAPPSAPEFSALAESGLTSWCNFPTYPSWAPLRCIDHLWTRGIEVSDCKAVKWHYSDHLAVSALLHLPVPLTQVQ